MRLAARAEGAWDPTKAGQAVDDILQSHPDISGFILDGYPDLRTLKILGRAKVKVVVQGGSKVAYQQVRKGLIAGGTVAYPSTYTDRAMTALLQVLAGKKVGTRLECPQEGLDLTAIATRNCPDLSSQPRHSASFHQLTGRSRSRSSH